MIDIFIDRIIKAVFSKPSLLVHTIFCGVQFTFNVDQNLVTNIISWEAIFLALMIGIQQYRHMESTKKHHKLVEKHVLGKAK